MSNINFTKAKIMFGQSNNDKLVEAQKIANKRGSFVIYNSESFKHLSIRPFSFSECTKETKTIIIIGCPKDFKYEMFFDPIVSGISVKKRGKDKFSIWPMFIFISECKPDLIGCSFTARVEFIDIRELE
jgi:hypothetical protein